ncbi:uncharacterized protein LOC113865165 [Abrus precatorius]|uniref:Uncharacterized protein LOC113865165 n=1 Tax=Abrus precatorius TaxID=3816 RepID=A0A8B8LG68_ABRPR|nr:uncharacterized protein LOC113865165 [Abrus precatorius]
MGTCASSAQYTNKSGNQSWQSTVSIVKLDGNLQQLKKPIKAWHVLSQNPNCFICCSESMYVGSPMLPIPPNDELQLGHIYFIMPLCKSRLSLSLQDLCGFAIKANAALASSKANYSISKSKSSSQRSFRTHPTLSNVSLGYSH